MKQFRNFASIEKNKCIAASESERMKQQTNETETKKRETVKKKARKRDSNNFVVIVLFCFVGADYFVLFFILIIRRIS